MTAALYYYTIDTGQGRDSPRSKVSPDAIAVCRALLRLGTHPLPIPGGYRTMAGRYRPGRVRLPSSGTHHTTGSTGRDICYHWKTRPTHGIRLATVCQGVPGVGQAFERTTLGQASRSQVHTLDARPKGRAWPAD